MTPAPATIDLTGLTLAEATEIVAAVGLRSRVAGSGTAACALCEGIVGKIKAAVEAAGAGIAPEVERSDS